VEISQENLARFARIMFPPSPEAMLEICENGFNDTLDFLERNSMISCQICIEEQTSVNSRASKGEDNNEWEVSCLQCKDCEKRKKVS